MRTSSDSHAGGSGVRSGGSAGSGVRSDESTGGLRPPLANSGPGVRTAASAIAALRTPTHVATPRSSRCPLIARRRSYSIIPSCPADGSGTSTPVSRSRKVPSESLARRAAVSHAASAASVAGSPCAHTSGRAGRTRHNFARPRAGTRVGSRSRPLAIPERTRPPVPANHPRRNRPHRRRSSPGRSSLVAASISAATVLGVRASATLGEQLKWWASSQFSELPALASSNSKEYLRAAGAIAVRPRAADVTVPQPPLRDVVEQTLRVLAAEFRGFRRATCMSRFHRGLPLAVLDERVRSPCANAVGLVKPSRCCQNAISLVVRLARSTTPLPSATCSAASERSLPTMRGIVGDHGRSGEACPTISENSACSR